jgi:hypothetical protein
LDQARHLLRVDLLGEREIRRDHRDIAQRQCIERRYKDRAARDLCGVLRSADHRRPDMLGWLDERHTETGGAGADCVRQGGPQIVEMFGLAPVDKFGNAAGECERTDRSTPAQRIEAQQRTTRNHRRSTPHGFEQAIRHRTGKPLRVALRELATGLEGEPEFGAKALPGWLDAPNSSICIDADEPGSDIERGDGRDPAIGTDRDL